MRCRLYEFPSGEDRAVAERAVQIFLTSQNAATRSLMLRTARAVLDKFRISKLKLNGYSVEATIEPGWAMIIGGQEVTGRSCPGCGADIYVWPGIFKKKEAVT